MNRRDLLVAVGGGVVAWPFAVRAQQSFTPVVGFLNSGSESPPHAAFREGLKDAGYVDGDNVTVDYRWADGDYERLPAMAADLVRRRVAVIVAGGGAHTALVAKEATKTIPIVFAFGSDPVKFGLVPSLSRPGGNITGVSFFAAELEAKRLGLLHELVPRAKVVAALVNPNNANAPNQIREVNDAAHALRLDLHTLKATTERELAAALANLSSLRAGALLVASDPFFYARRQHLVGLVSRQAVPAIYEWREFAHTGGLLSYGTSIAEAYRQAGIYAGRVLKGEKPADLPVVRSTRFELVINLKTAKTLGLDVSPELLARADEVIE